MSQHFFTFESEESPPANSSSAGLNRFVWTHKYL